MNPDDNEKNSTIIKLDEYFKLKINDKLNNDEYCLTQNNGEIKFSKKMAGAPMLIEDNNTSDKNTSDKNTFESIYKTKEIDNKIIYYKIYATKDSKLNSYTINVKFDKFGQSKL
jgi:hypothetical protein